jgi:hypothetical protein
MLSQLIYHTSSKKWYHKITQAAKNGITKYGG